jgi:DNA helicase-2/ATP-dependent DNA helicase PcrA
MRGRLRTLGAGGVQARTFHSAALRQLRYFWPHVHGTELPTLTESKIGLLATAARRHRIATDQALLRDLASEVEWAKVSNVHPDDYARVATARGRSVTGQDPETVGRVFAGYEEVKRGQGRMDMEDVLLLTAGILADDERVAAQVRRQYKWFVVDEFQDVSPLQSALLDLWLGGRDEICVVGDPAQTIYSFAGANASYLLDFPKKFPGATSVDLVRNYRSTPEVVAAANTLLARSSSRGVELRAQRTSGPAVTYTSHPDEVAEADAAATAIARLRDGGRSLAEVAVLFRINAQSEAFEEALSGRGLPYVIRGAKRFFERPEVREAVTRLRGAARSGEGDDALLETVRGTLAGMGWTPDAPTARGQTRDRWESWQALVNQATEFATTPGADLNAFVDDLDRRASEQHAPVADGVTLATFHAAKGLEWDSVFLCGLQDGTLPITYAETPAAIEEERRLLYVGMTRARVDLALSWALARNPGGRGSRKPSRFLDDLLPEQSRAAEPRRQRKVANCRECGRPLSTGAEKKRGRCAACPASYDEELFERLREWRRERAGEESVPAFVVFTDATLQLIAEHKPRTPDALLRISGIGQSKLDRYGEGVLEVVG